MIYLFKTFLLLTYFLFPGKIIANNNIYLVENNEVIIVHQDILEARELAKQYVVQDAFSILFDRICFNCNLNEISGFEEIDFLELIRDFSIKEEEYFNFEYKALININFDSSKTNKLLSNLNLVYSTTISEEYLILPLHYYLNTYFLWEKNNALYATLRDNYEKNNLLKLYFPELSIFNKFKISYNDILNENLEAFENILSFYKKKSAIIFFLDERFDYQSEKFISNLEVKVFSEGLIKTLKFNEQDFMNFYSKQSAIQNIVKSSLKALNNWWKNQIIVLNSNKDEINKYIIISEFSTLEESMTIQNQLQKNPFINELIPIMFSKSKITYDLFTYGSLEKLKLALRSINFDIIETGESNKFSLKKLE